MVGKIPTTMTIFLFGSNTMPDNIKPAMSVDGWISAGGPKLDSLIDDFYCSEYSQTYLYRGEVCSLQWMVQQHIHDPYGLCNLLNERLKRYLERYFESASVETTWYNKNTNESKAALKLAVTVRDKNGTVSNFNDIQNVVESRAMKTINANNGD